MEEKEYYDKYITNTEDFFNLPEPIQDKLLTNYYFKYEDVWERLSTENRIQLLLYNYDFKYEKYWYELSEVEKEIVIENNNNFNCEKYLPNPTTEEFSLLIQRQDFNCKKYFNKLNDNQKYIVCSKRNFNYEKFWNELNSGMRLEIIRHNLKFDPEPYIDYLSTELDGEKTFLDIYTERKNGIYDNIWNKLNDHQKMIVSIKNVNFEVGDKKQELYKLFKKFPFMLLDFIEKKIIPQTYLGVKELKFEELDMSIKDLSIDLFKSFSLIDYEEVKEGRKEIITGNLRTIKMSDKFQKIYPCCIVKNEKEYLYYNISSDQYRLIDDYNYILREVKLERLLKNNIL